MSEQNKKKNPIFNEGSAEELFAGHFKTFVLQSTSILTSYLSGKVNVELFNFLSQSKDSMLNWLRRQGNENWVIFHGASSLPNVNWTMQYVFLRNDFNLLSQFFPRKELSQSSTNPLVLDFLENWTNHISNLFSNQFGRLFTLSSLKEEQPNNVESVFEESKYLTFHYILQIANVKIEFIQCFSDSVLNLIHANRMDSISKPEVQHARSNEAIFYCNNQANVASIRYRPINPENLNEISSLSNENISLLLDLSMKLSVELGRTRMSIRKILALGEGAIIRLDKLAGEPVDLFINSKLIARGEVVIIDKNFGVRITDVLGLNKKLNRLF